MNECPTRSRIGDPTRAFDGITGRPTRTQVVDHRPTRLAGEEVLCEGRGHEVAAHGLAIWHRRRPRDRRRHRRPLPRSAPPFFDRFLQPAQGLLLQRVGLVVGECPIEFGEQHVGIETEAFDQSRQCMATHGIGDVEDDLHGLDPVGETHDVVDVAVHDVPVFDRSREHRQPVAAAAAPSSRCP